MSSQQMQEDGSYPRLNSSQVRQGLGDNMTISVVGKMVSVDGPMVQLRTTDGGTLNLCGDPASFTFVRVCTMFVWSKFFFFSYNKITDIASICCSFQDKNVEVMGSVTETKDIEVSFVATIICCLQNFRCAVQLHSMTPQHSFILYSTFCTW